MSTPMTASEVARIFHGGDRAARREGSQYNLDHSRIELDEYTAWSTAHAALTRARKAGYIGEDG